MSKYYNRLLPGLLPVYLPVHLYEFVQGVMSVKSALWFISGGVCVAPEFSGVDLFREDTGSLLKKDEIIKNGQVFQASCKAEFTSLMDNYVETNVTCIDGRLIGDIPNCPQGK